MMTEISVVNWNVVSINMKIKFLHKTNGHDYRIQHLFETLSLKNDVEYIELIDDLNQTDDILFFESRHELTDDVKFKILNFKGKVIFYSVGDGCEIPPYIIKNEIFDKISVWVSLLRNPNLPREILDKMVLIPRWTIPYIDTTDINYDTKINKIVFIGRTTGAYHLNGKNWRIECLNKIYNNKKLNDNFDGWIVDDKILDTTEQYSEYNKNFKFVKKNEYISEKVWIEKLKSHTLSLCIPGHSILGYRHPQSMATMATMIGNFDLTKDPYPYMFSDKMVDMSYVIKNDLSDLENVFVEALDNTFKTKEYALKAYDFYKTYYEVKKNNTYQDLIWYLIKNNFQKLNIDI